MKLVKPILLDLLYICQHMQEDEREQWEAFSGEEFDAEAVAIACANKYGPKFALIDDNDTPLVAGGFEMIRPGVWNDWMIGTADAWEKHWRTISKHCRRLVDALLEKDAHRVQCVTLASRIHARRWNRIVKYREEGTLHGYGVNGEDGIMFARVREE